LTHDDSGNDILGITVLGTTFMVVLINALWFFHSATTALVTTTVTSAVVVFLFLAGLWFTEAILNGPNFHPKLNLVAPTIGYSISCCFSC